MQIEYIDHMGSDLTVVNTARVSMDKWHNQFEEENDTRLIKYLVRENHFSPLSHPKIQVRITLPIFIARQWEKHRIGALRGYDIYDQNEVSRRYVDKEPEFFYPDKWRERPADNIKQGSGAEFDLEMQNYLIAEYNDFVQSAKKMYLRFIDNRVAPEQVRMLLPQSMYTSWIETGSLLYWARVFKLRTDGHAQKEIQDLASQLDPIIRPLFPVSWGALVT